MDKPILVRNARIIDTVNDVDIKGDLLIDETGCVTTSLTGKSDQNLPDSHVIDAEGMILCPGFIDLHCHLRQPGFEYKETIATGTRAAARGGFTTICSMPNTEPAIDSPESIRDIKRIAENEGIVRVIPISAVTKGRKGAQLVPLAEIASEGIAGYSDDGSPVYDGSIMRKALLGCLQLGLPVIEHCEVLELAGKGVINEGEVSRRLAVEGIPDAAEEDMIARDIELAKETGGWVHIAHASTAGSVELIRKGKADGVKVTAEVTPHHLTLTEDEVTRCGSQAKVNPPLRTRKDIEALIEGLNDGTIDIIATDHAPHAEKDKPEDLNAAAFGFTGFETALGSLMQLVHDDKISINLLINALTWKPALLLGNRSGVTGTLVTDEPVDLVLFDPHKEWQVDPSRFASKGKNTPLSGTILKGKVMMTIYRGEPVFIDESISL